MKIDNFSNNASLGKSKEAQTRPKQLTVDSVTNWQLPLLAILFVTVVFVAIKTVVYRHESRVAFMQLQKLEKERDKLAAQWSRLKLEQGAMLNQVRVEKIARWDLKMKLPKASEVRVVREPSKVVDIPVAHLMSKKTKTTTEKEFIASKVALSD